MPYIAQSARGALDVWLLGLAEHVQLMPVEEQDGAINYAVTTLLKTVYPHRYFHFNRAIGVLECVKQEFYRTQVAPYEEIKRHDHGDVGALPPSMVSATGSSSTPLD